MKRALLPALVLFSSVPLLAADLLPPDEVLSNLAKSSKKSGEGSASAAETLAAKLEAFAATSPSLTPQEAAKTWLELFQAWRELSPAERNRMRNPATSGFASLVRSLPPPTAWEALQSDIAAGPTKDILIDQLLALFSATLNDDAASQLNAFNAIASLKESDYAKSPSLGAVEKVMGEYVGKYVNALVQDLAPPLAQLSDDPAEVRQILEAQLKAALDLQEGYQATLVLPSIAALGGEKPATEFIKKVLSSGAVLESSDPKLRAIARTLILEDPARLKVPHWNLVDGFGEEAIRLYQLLERKFTNDENSEYERKEAGKFYLMSLIVADKFDAAYKWLTSIKDLDDRSLGYDTQQLAISQGKGENVLNFLFMALAKDPSLPLWSELIELAAREGRSGKALELTRTAAKSKKLEASDRENLLSLLSAAALADGKVDEAIVFMRECMTILKEQGPESNANAFDLAEQLAILGQLLKRNDLRDEGIRDAMAIASEPAEDRRLSSDFVDLLVQSGRTTDAQNLIIAGMKPALNRETDYAPTIDLTDNLTDLAGLYDLAERPNDVLKLLTEAPWWKTSDLAGIVTEKDFRGVSIGEMAARAFVANANKPKAIETLKETLKSAADDDSAYRMLIELDGQNAIPFLDEQFAGNQFQERPLIWKAVLQLQAGQTTEAETTIRQAIAIDPSDGEMGRNDRMRAYAVLADILEKTGKEADAKIYRGAVQAVRLAEEADRYVSAGLLSQAITMYKQALGYFADAYCIQSRLAVHLATQGNTKEAEEHYRRAYELMPDSFGRMESHCFGCERAFDGLMAETLAEKTFRRLIAENPTKPQLHYLMGYLRMEQDKPEDALAYFQKAVELDPDYINAWKKILSLDGSMLLPNKVRNDAALAILWLEQNASAGELHKVTDLKKVWTLTEEIQRNHPIQKPQDLLRLDATAQLREDAGNRNQQNPFLHAPFSSQERLDSPGAALMQQELMQRLSQVFDQVSQLRR